MRDGLSDCLRIVSHLTALDKCEMSAIRPERVPPTYLVLPIGFEPISPCLKGKFPKPLEEGSIGTGNWIRTSDFHHVKVALLPLSYVSIVFG